jgi:DNA-binding GntR family transcriptional regulator
VPVRAKTLLHGARDCQTGQPDPDLISLSAVRQTVELMASQDFSIIRVPAPIRQQVQNNLRAMIAEGYLGPGDRLVERELCERLNVSRPVMREALRLLEAEGLLTTIPGRGLAVAVIGADDAHEIYRIRALLEGEAAAASAIRAEPKSLRDIQSRTQAVEEALQRGNAADMRRAKNRFYETLIASSGNRALADMLRIIHGRIQLLRTITLNEPGRMQAAAKEIRAICDAIVGGMAEEARALSMQHIANAAAAMDRALRQASSRSRGASAKKSGPAA